MDEQDTIERRKKAELEINRVDYTRMASASSESYVPFDLLAKWQIRGEVVHYQKSRADVELSEYSVQWDRITD